MKPKTQTCWALVHANGHINHGNISFNRKYVIEAVISEYRAFRLSSARHAHMSDAQLWRFIKRRRGYSVRRINMKVAR